MSSWQGSNHLKLKYRISGCRFFVDEGPYVQVFTVLSYECIHEEDSLYSDSFVHQSNFEAHARDLEHTFKKPN